MRRELLNQEGYNKYIELLLQMQEEMRVFISSAVNKPFSHCGSTAVTLRLICVHQPRHCWSRAHLVDEGLGRKEGDERRNKIHSYSLNPLKLSISNSGSTTATLALQRSCSDDSCTHANGSVWEGAHVVGALGVMHGEESGGREGWETCCVVCTVNISTPYTDINAVYSPNLPHAVISRRGEPKLSPTG